MRDHHKSLIKENIRLSLNWMSEVLFISALAVMFGLDKKCALIWIFVNVVITALVSVLLTIYEVRRN